MVDWMKFAMMCALLEKGKDEKARDLNDQSLSSGKVGSARRKPGLAI